MFLNGLKTNNEKRTKKKNKPEKIVFFEKNDPINALYPNYHIAKMYIYNELLEILGSMVEELINNYPSLRGFIFGFVHVFITVIGYYTGWSINRLLKVASRGYIAGIIGAAMAHIVADLVASIIDPSIRPMTLGIILGGTMPLLMIPIFEKISSKKQGSYHGR